MERVLQFWYPNGDPQAPEYDFEQRLWFHSDTDMDQVIRDQFEADYEMALEGKLDSWCDQGPLGKLALLILVDQFSRNIHRGTSGMFHDNIFKVSIPLALELLSSDSHLQLALPQRLFVYLALIRSEDVEHVTRAVDLLRQLHKDATQYVAGRRAGKYLRQVHIASKYLDVINRFGRYPQRNRLLGRESTLKEATFLAKAEKDLSGIFFDQIPRISRRKSKKNAKTDGDLDQESDSPMTLVNDETNPNPDDFKMIPSSIDRSTNLKSLRRSRKKRRKLALAQKLLQDQAEIQAVDGDNRMRVLVLHGYRQNRNVIRRGLAELDRLLKQTVELVYAQSPLLVRDHPENDSSDDVPRSQRCWFWSCAQNTHYQGLQDSFHFLNDVFAAQGPFDGIIGFSHGAIIATLLSSLQEVGQLRPRYPDISFRFVVLLSGAPPRDHRYLSDISQLPTTINIPSLHLYGLKDRMIEPARSRALIEMYSSEMMTVLEHKGSHFSPSNWPIVSLKEFILLQEQPTHKDKKRKIDRDENENHSIGGDKMHQDVGMEGQPSSSSSSSDETTPIDYDDGNNLIRQYSGLLYTPKNQRIIFHQDQREFWAEVLASDAKHSSLDYHVIHSHVQSIINKCSGHDLRVLIEDLIRIILHLASTTIRLERQSLEKFSVIKSKKRTTLPLHKLPIERANWMWCVLYISQPDFILPFLGQLVEPSRTNTTQQGWEDLLRIASLVNWYTTQIRDATSLNADIPDDQKMNCDSTQNTSQKVSSIAENLVEYVAGFFAEQIKIDLAASGLGLDGLPLPSPSPSSPSSATDSNNTVNNQQSPGASASADFRREYNFSVSHSNGTDGDQKRDELDPDDNHTSGFVSRCALIAPRIKSAIDRSTGISRRIALMMNPLAIQNPAGAKDNQADDTDTSHPPVSLSSIDYTTQKGISYAKYRRSVAVLTRLFHSQQGKPQIRQNELHIFRDEQSWQVACAQPISQKITFPEPEPKAPCQLDELEPLFDWLKSDSSVPKVTAFPKGSACPDGRLDLCKQVVGRQGITPLLDAMGRSSQVKALLLGNNYVGDGGAKAIANFIREKGNQSSLDTWYIAGNEFTATGASEIARVLKTDTKVKALWLKRNPLRFDGIVEIADIFRFNHTIVTLDVVNTGLLDQGTRVLMEALAENKTLEHLYMGCNGITPEGCKHIAKFLASGANRLTTLFASANRFGDEGASILASALANDTKLQRLCFASNRIGPPGAKALSEALKDHPSLQLLNLGFVRSTIAVGELGNRICDEGAKHISSLLRANCTIRRLDLTNNSISQVGLTDLYENGLKHNDTLIDFEFSSWAKVHNSITKSSINSKLIENRQIASQAGISPKELNKIRFPPHIKDIESVYRTA